MIHGFDIDGVVTDPRVLASVIGKEYKGFEYHHLVDYHIAQSLVKSGFIDRVEDFDEKSFFLEHNPSILANAVISDGFTDYLKRIGNDDIHFITARGVELEGYTEELFYNNNIPFCNVHHIGSTNKDKTVEKLGVQKFYEDNLETAVRVAGYGKTEVIVVDTPYNQMSVFPYKTMKRIKNWREL